MAEFVGAVDQGTTSSRFMIFDHDGREVAKSQLEHEQILPQPGWVEHDPVEIASLTEEVVRGALADSNLTAADLVAVGVTNQRETTVVWNPKTGQPWCNAIVWQDTRTADIVNAVDADDRGDVVRRKAGLPPATYFSAGKIRWILDNVEGVRDAIDRGEAVFGTIDSWVLWNLTGGPKGGIHATDVTNASRTMLMDLQTLQWDDDLLRIFEIPRKMLPEILPSAAPYGEAVHGGPFGGPVKIGAMIGDQQAATVGQACFLPGETKNTYGTGNFMLMNTGGEIVLSDSGLLTTAAYRFGSENPVYALEGSVAVTGSAVQWLRDQIGLIASAQDVEVLANTVEDSGGVYFVPAFSGLFAPYWRSDARGTIVGLTRYSDRGHLARATLEAICYQTRDVLEAMRVDSDIDLQLIKVDGGATSNNTLMQLQADILGVTVVRPVIAETTALGAAYAAGLYAGFWDDLDDVRRNWQEDRRFEPRWNEDRRDQGYTDWKRAVERTFDWANPSQPVE
jgi:glycerol kinase